MARWSGCAANCSPRPHAGAQPKGREALRRDARGTRDASSLYGLIYPERHLQERLYSILPFLAKHGLDLIGHIYGSIELDCSDHRLMVI